MADHRSAGHGERLDRIIEALEIEIVPVSTRQGAVAREAHRRYGRGSGSPARLNFGDCFAYALSVEAGEPLLFTGDDFAHTDVARVAGARADRGGTPGRRTADRRGCVHAAWKTVRVGALLTVGALLMVGLTASAHGRPAARHTPESARSITVGTVHARRCHLGVGRPTWCGSLRLPLDYTDPTAPRIRIGFGWVPSRRPATGTLLAMEGGPGYPSTGTAGDFAAMYGGLLRDHDLLLVDARGTGRSTPLRVPAPATPPLAVAEVPARTDHLRAPAEPHLAPRGRHLGARLGPVHHREHRPRRRPHPHRPRARQGRPVRRLVRHLLRPVVPLPLPRSAALGGARLGVRGARSRPVVPHDARDRAARLRHGLPAGRRLSSRVIVAPDRCTRPAAARPPGRRVGCRAPTPACTATPSTSPRSSTSSTTPATTPIPTASSTPRCVPTFATATRRRCCGCTPRTSGTTTATTCARSRRTTTTRSTSRSPAPTIRSCSTCTAHPPYDGTSWRLGWRTLLDSRFAPFSAREWSHVLGYTEAFRACLTWPRPTHRHDPPVPPGPMDRRHVPVLVLNGSLDSLTPAAGGAHVARQIGPLGARVRRRQQRPPRRAHPRRRVRCAGAEAVHPRPHVRGCRTRACRRSRRSVPSRSSLGRWPRSIPATGHASLTMRRARGGRRGGRR